MTAHPMTKEEAPSLLVKCHECHTTIPWMKSIIWKSLILGDIILCSECTENLQLIVEETTPTS